MSIEWKNPPNLTRGRASSKWRLVLDELRDNPGVWALVETKDKDTQAANAAAGLRRGRYGGASKGEFESTSRGVEVYARYVGEV